MRWPCTSIALRVVASWVMSVALLVPALVALFGKWNWWLPGWLAKRLPNFSVE